MLSTIISRRMVSNVSMVRPLISGIRLYTVVPSTPQTSGPTTQANVQNSNHNDIHALYNNENQSVHESHYVPGQTYRSLSSDDTATFSPTFNSVFDE